MKNLKHLFALVLALALMLCLCACTTEGKDNTTEPADSTGTTESSEASTEESTEASVAEPAEPTYVIKVVDLDGNPIPNALVQMCQEICVPVMTDENGVAEFYLPEASDYKVSFAVVPEGYTYATEDEVFYFEDGSNEMTLTLKAIEVEEPIAD